MHFCVWREVGVKFYSLQMEFTFFQHSFLFQAFLFLFSCFGVGQKSTDYL